MHSHSWLQRLLSQHRCAASSLSPRITSLPARRNFHSSLRQSIRVSAKPRSLYVTPKSQKPFQYLVSVRWSSAVSYSTASPASTTSSSSNAACLKDDSAPFVPLAKKVLVVGSGGLSIGQAGEFDYSGSQAIKALKEEGVETILINPNIATIQTDRNLADNVYFLPVTPEYVSYIIERERPDGILLNFGGQTALNCGIALDKMGVLEKFNVKVLGTPISTLITSEDRDLFAKALQEIDIPIAKSLAVESVEDALKAADEISYPVIVRSAFALGGLGSGFAANPAELKSLATKSLSLSPQILVERSMKGWKEVEYEVVRDAEDNCITVCNMENFDPLGIHTGDSIVVAPSQTLSDEEYHMLRSAAIKIIRHLGVVGECNVQYALNPKSLEYAVIEVNARLSRSSALASKATGYPLAFVAAKIAIGHSLPTLRNAVTKTTTACFEPSLDYIVTKIPRWDLNKFSHVKREVGSQMKSVGEVMAVGRTFEESLQKAIRQVDPSFQGFFPIVKNETDTETLKSQLAIPTDRRLFHLAEAMYRNVFTIPQIHDITKIDNWFLHKLQNIVDLSSQLNATTLPELSAETLSQAKKSGFSDKLIAECLKPESEGANEKKSSEWDVRMKRKEAGIIPVVKRIDTLAAEFPAQTNYLFMTYNGTTDDLTFNDKGTMVLGSGVYRIGSSVEFDWCGVSCIRSLRSLGHKTVMVNYNPETVSTDFDECDRLYFEELSMERVMDIYEKENASGVVVSVGGQLPQNIALKLYEKGVNVLGTSPVNIDMAEDRFKFSQVLDKIGVGQPDWKELTNMDDATKFAANVGYPVLVRPSYVLSGVAMKVAHNDADLKTFLSAAADVSPEHPVVITKFIQGAQEIDIDAVAYKGKLLVHAVSEHVENAGVHSGDATLILPSRELSTITLNKLKTIASQVSEAFEITGPFNMQIIKAGSDLKVIECNLRASRSFPFVSKVLDTNFIDIATHAIVDQNVPEPVDLMAAPRSYQCIKVPQFSWTRLAGADPILGVEMASTGEVACFGKDKYEAYLTSLQATNGFKLPATGSSIVLGKDHLTSVEDFVKVASALQSSFKLLSNDQSIIDLLQTKKIQCTLLPIFNANESYALTRGHVKNAIQSENIQFVINLSVERPLSTTDENYIMRRTAVDLGVPVLTDAKCAVLFAEALVKRTKVLAEMKGKNETIPPEVKSWKEFVPPKVEDGGKTVAGASV
ncbi:large subunit of carbamoyl-phosphate synthase [Paraphysoderma sedebokerense]|nr:large subunit of carbamoyl-phosphate synthase [Paraphysoderma sedebokerense]